MTATDLNYDIHDMEMLAIDSAFKEWNRYFEGAEHSLLVFSDYLNLKYFNMTKVLTYGQARWDQEFTEYNFKIVSHPRNLNRKPEALLSR
jgi:hypothetical protein